MNQLKKLKQKIDNDTCTISDLKDIYEIVNTKSEVIVAKNDGIIHLYYRDNIKETVRLEKNLIPYEKKICEMWEHTMYPLDLCNLTFYDEITNRYGQGIIIPRIKKFVMIDDMDLIKEPVISSSFYTIGIRENNEECGSIVDRMGNLYRMYGYDKNDGNFTFRDLEIFTFPSCLYQPYGILINYNNRPIYAKIKQSPYIVFDRETLEKCSDEIRNIDDYIKRFDDDFMQGKRYVKK